MGARRSSGLWRASAHEKPESSVKLFLDLMSSTEGVLALVVTLISLALAIGFHVFLRGKVRQALAEHDASRTP